MVSREPIFEDDISYAEGFDEDGFYTNRENQHSRSDIPGLLGDYEDSVAPEIGLKRRQQTTGAANPNNNVVAAGGIAPAQTQTQNVTAVPKVNSTENTTTGLTPGLIGNLRNPNEDKVNCSDPVTGRANDCWSQLGLSKYVNDWVATHECYQGEGFATCYLRQNGFTTLDCSGIAINACVPPQDPSLVLDPQKFYVAYNIYCKLPQNINTCSI